MVMSAELKKVSREYAERVCNGEFPITYNREQVVNHTANDFAEGWNRSIEENKPEWFKAGGMAERILIDWEMKQLKEKLQQVLESHKHLMQQLKDTNEELDNKQSKLIALGDRIKMMMEEKEVNDKLLRMSL